MEVDGSTSHGRRTPCGTPPRDRGAPRPLREDARQAPLVGLVRALPERSSAGEQSGGGRRRRRPIYGRGPSCSSPVTPFERPHSAEYFDRHARTGRRPILEILMVSIDLSEMRYESRNPTLRIIGCAE